RPSVARSLTRDGETVIAFPSFRFRWTLVLVPVFLTFAAVLWLLGSRNPYTPAGYVGYLTKGAVFGQARFYGVQRGPISAGRGWLLEGADVRVTADTDNADVLRAQD